ncbi:MAG TPA: fused MFS/spermidine synthase [Solirubrobacteraceae bacterium]|nr:fused MFS/spermidine synthase [Solirubrobacteraceae bacterium]
MGEAYPAPVAAALVFVASGAVLVLEILGIRLLAPYVGLTLETTTAIIGTVLAGIAAGAAVGGRAADRHEPRRLLALLLTGGGALAVATVPMARGLGSSLEGQGDAAAVLIALFALFPPAAVLSAVTPAVARVQLRDLSSTGSVVGRLSAWATAGALLGTFATGFVLVPLLPTDVAVLAVGTVLLALGAAVALKGGGTRGVVVALVVTSVAIGAATAAAGSPCDAETAYHCAKVLEDPWRSSGRVLVLEDLRHSYVDLADSRHLEFDYIRWIGDAVDAMPAGPLDAVFLGGGGFTLPRYLTATRPGTRSHVLEVDGDLVTLARERLGLRTGPALSVRVGDARVTLRDEPDASADLVVGDAFGGRSIPWHLATAEFAREIRRVLRPGGLYALNVIDHASLSLLRAEVATLLDTFEDVRVITHDELGGGNFVVLASDRPLPADIRSTARGARTLDGAAAERLAGDADPLRDDDAPADQLLTPRA